MTILTQAQSQDPEGTGNSTHHGSRHPNSPHKETRRSSAPAALHASEGGAAGEQENGTHSDGQDGANDTTPGNIGPCEDAHTTEQEAANQTPTTDPAEPNPGEDTDVDRKLRAVYGDTIH